MSELELEEERWLTRDALEAAVQDIKPTQRSGYKMFSFATIAYLGLNALSVRTPGPAHWLGFDTHVRLIGHVLHLF